jgi:hypothetical protein
MLRVVMLRVVNKPASAPFLKFRGRLGSGGPDNLITLCVDCHSKEQQEN